MNRLLKLSCVASVVLLLALGTFLAKSPQDPAEESPRPSRSPPGGETAYSKPPLQPEICQESLELVAGESLGRDLKSGESCTYDFHLDVGTYLEMVVEQHGIDVVVRLLGPGDVEYLWVDNPQGAFGLEPVLLVATRSGRHRLEVRPWTSASSGSYRLHIEAVRFANREDRERALGARVFSEAEKLRREREPTAARTRYRQALEHWETTGDSFYSAVALERIGGLHKRQRQYFEALQPYRQSIQRYHEAGDFKKQISKIFNHLGSCYRRLDDWQNALDSYDRARRLARQVRDPRQQAASHNNIAIVYRSLGKFQEAIHHYEEAIARWQEVGDATEEARTWVNVGWLYIGLGQPAIARNALGKALSLTSDPGDPLAREADSMRLRRVEAGALNALARVQRQQGQFGEALKSLRRSLSLRQSLPDRPSESITLKAICRTYLELGDGEAALQACEQALDLARERKNRRVEGVVLNELGWLYNEALDQPQRALDYFRDARKLFQQANNPQEQASSLYGEARAERDRGNLDQARSRVEEALAIVESLRTEPDDPKDRTYFLADKQDYYELNIDLLIALHDNNLGAGYAGEALEVSERRRARTLLDVLHASFVDRAMEQVLHPTRPPASREEERRTQQRLLELSPERIWPPLSAKAQDPVLLSLREIRQLLDDDTLLLEYSLGEARSFLWSVTTTDVEIHKLPSRSEIKALAESAYGLLAKSYLRRTRGAREWAMAELSRVLLGPIADRLENQRLLIVSEEALQYIPFGALPILSSPGGGPGRRVRPLVENHEIVYLPSLSVLALLRQQLAERPRASKLVAVVADPVFEPDDSRFKRSLPRISSAGHEEKLPLPRLELSRQEAAAILSLVPEEERFAAFDFAANKQVVTGGRLADYRFVHLATHALFDAQNPERMGVMLSRLDEDRRALDGLLRPHEIYHLRLPVDMVVVSACQSGLGKEVRGEGLVGLTQGLFRAGAGRVVVSFWRVDDRATAELMEKFYRGILEDQLKPAAALRAAQLAMLRDVRWRSPYYWAGFFLQGEWR